MSDKSPIDPKASNIRDGNADVFVSANIPCLTCEYNLKSLSTQGLCPECGQPVRDTLDHYQLVGQAAMLYELAAFATSMTTSLFLVSLALVGTLVFSQIPFRPLGFLIMLIFVPFYYLSAMGGGIDIFRITKRPAFGHGVVVVFMGMVAIGLTFHSATPRLDLFIVLFVFGVAVALFTGTPVWFAQHTKHLATLVGNAKLKSLATITYAICLVLPTLTLIYIGWLAISNITGQPRLPLFQPISGFIKLVVLTVILATSTSSALLGLKLVAAAKKLRRTAQALQSQTSIDTSNSA